MAAAKKRAAKPALKRKPRRKRAVASNPTVDKTWEAEEDLRTLRRAVDIGASPTRLSAARAIAKKEMAALKKIG